jgi:hypothetical protein
MTDPLIIAFAGHAGAGKDTAAAYLVERYGFVQAAFADPIRSMALILMEEAGIDDAWLTERTMKESAMPGLGVSARALLQTLGTEVGRHLSRDLWTRHMGLRLGLEASSYEGELWPRQPVHDRIVISDCRFENEAQWVKRYGGTVIRLHRMQAGTVRDHVSEAQVMSLPADVDIHNHGLTVDGLHALLDGAMATLGIEPREDTEPLRFTQRDPAGRWGGAVVQPLEQEPA